MTARDGICEGCQDIGMANCIACIQRRNREDMEKMSKVTQTGRETLREIEEKVARYVAENNRSAERGKTKGKEGDGK